MVVSPALYHKSYPGKLHAATFYISHLLYKELDALCVPLPDGGQQDRDTVLVLGVHVSALEDKESDRDNRSR